MMQTSDYRRFLIPSVVARLSNIELKAKFVVQGFIAGLHKSPYHGFSVEFAEHRQYTPGDDLRYLDWKLLARTDRYYIKQYEEETNLKAYILLDISRSMSFSSKNSYSKRKNKFFKKNNSENLSDELSKLEYASYIAASLAYLMILQRDAVSLVTYDEKIRTYIPPHSTKANLQLILKELQNLKPSSKTNTLNSLNAIAEKIKRRGLIIIISDFLDNQSEVINCFKHFRYDKNEVIVFQVLDVAEKNFLFDDIAYLKDMETGEEIYVQPSQIKDSYDKFVENFISEYRNQCIKNNIDYELLTTSTPFDVSLLRYLNKRMRLN
ncbi:MAG: DUF58 domain-containing protein [Ignavibacteria bacterium]|nr:DUF58 domain-containing protein [Ignavibacteria bacterium]